MSGCSLPEGALNSLGYCQSLEFFGKDVYEPTMLNVYGKVLKISLGASFFFTVETYD